MATIILRAGKGSALTSAEVDANFTNLNAELASKQSSLGYTAANKAGDTFTGNVLVNTGVDSRVLVQSNGTTVAQLQATATEARLHGVGAVPLTLWSDGVKILELTTSQVTINNRPLVSTNTITGSRFNGSAAGLTGLKTINGSSILGTGDIQVDGGVSSANLGFRNDVWYGGVRNPIWSFGNASTYGISYFQGEAGIGGNDAIGIHPNGVASATSSSFVVGTSDSYVNNNVVLHAANYSSYALPLSGGIVGGDIGVGAFSGQFNSISSNERTVYIEGSWIASLYLHSTSGRKYALYSSPSSSLILQDLTTGATRFTVSSSGAFNVAGALQQAGNQVLHAANYNSYSPTLTGGNASGTWGINVTGNSNTATTLQTSRTIDGIPFNGSANINTTEWVHSDRDFPNGTLITTNINYAVSSGDPFVLEIRGNSYGSQVPFDIQYQGYIYADTIINHGGVSNGTSISGLVAINNGGNLCFWFPNQSYWHGYNVKVYVPYATRATNRVTSITGVAKPTTAKEVALSTNIRQSLHSSNYTSYSPSLTGSGASGTWGISISGNAASANSASDAWQVNSDTNSKTSALQYWQSSGDSALNPNGNWHYAIRMSHGDAASYYSATLALDFHNDALQFRRKVDGVNQAWMNVLHSGNYTSYTAGYAGSAGSLRVQTGSGYVDIGPMNSDWSHFQTDRGRFYFNTSVSVNGDIQRYSDSATYLHSSNVNNYAFGWRGVLPTNGWNDAATGLWQSNGQADQTGGPGGYGWGGLLSFRSSDFVSGSHRLQIYASHTGSLAFRTGWNDWSYGWHELLSSANYNNYSPSLTGGGASGTWGINITGSAPWASISGKPAGVMYYQGFTLDANTMDLNATGFTYSANAPHTGPIVRFSGNGSYDLWLNASYSGGGNTLSFRTRNGDTGTMNPWRAVVHDGNYSSYGITRTTGSPAYYGARAWVNFNGTGTVAIRASQNVSSITDNGTGDYTVNFATAMPDANYTVSGMLGDSGNGTSALKIFTSGGFGGAPQKMDTSGVRLGATNADILTATVVVFR